MVDACSALLHDVLLAGFNVNMLGYLADFCALHIGFTVN